MDSDDVIDDAVDTDSNDNGDCMFDDLNGSFKFDVLILAKVILRKTEAMPRKIVKVTHWRFGATTLVRSSVAPL